MARASVSSVYHPLDLNRLPLGHEVSLSLLSRLGRLRRIHDQLHSNGSSKKTKKGKEKGEMEVSGHETVDGDSGP